MTKSKSASGPSVDKAAIATFAELILPDGEAPEGAAVHLFALPSKACYWPTTPGALVKQASALAERSEDVYIGVALRRLGLGRTERGKAEDCNFALGIGLDIDVGSDGHKGGKRRAPSVDVALEILSRMPLPPTIVVGSGGGLHCWWIYREPLELSEARERREAAAIALAWNRKLAEVARDFEVDIDSTFDFARVLRVPGTTNRKIADNPRPVTILSINETARYNPSELAAFLGSDLQTLEKTSSSVAVTAVDARLSPDAEPPQVKFYALLENFERFGQLWRRDPAVLRTLKDPSASGVDLALANIAVKAEWTDQEIVDLLIASRRKHGNDLKLREKYYSGTIAKARDGQDGSSKSAKQSREKREVEVAEAIDAAAAAPDPVDRREETLRLLSTFTGVDVVRIVSHGRDPARYRVELRTGESFHVESTERLISQHEWLCRAFEVNAHVPVEQPSLKNWRRLVAQLAQIAEFEPEEDSLWSSVAEYLSFAVECEGEDEVDQRAGLLATGRSVILEGGVAALHLPTLHRFLTDCLFKIDRPALRSRLRAYGFEPRTLSFSISGGPRSAASSRTYWIAGPETMARLDANSDRPAGAGRKTVSNSKVENGADRAN